ncbi:hypothetical protein [Bradyrhizobium sp. 930_D9_N1_4]|uniref:hypothetical protein n=1 Tax=Bradyrhizobium sp. 930_D9_N1_4 TaxID=3240374 RepID=UPI003F8AC67E
MIGATRFERAVLEAINLGEARVIARSASKDHLTTIKAEMLRLAAKGAQFGLAGTASSIPRISRALKATGVASSRIKRKADWAMGKSGLD